MANEITIKVNGIPEALAMLKKYQRRKKEQIKNELKVGALTIEGLAKEAVLVDTGNLRARITHDFSEIEVLIAKVGTNVTYAPYVEFGTKHWAGRAFLFPSFFSHENEIIKAIGRALKKDIGVK